jgi:hypothetical protein
MKEKKRRVAVFIKSGNLPNKLTASGTGFDFV